MSKHLISAGILLAVLQACSGKPVEFQGDSASSAVTNQTGDATGAQGNRDSSSGDAVASTSEDATAADSSMNSQEISSDSDEMESAIYSGSDVLVAIPDTTASSTPTTTAANDPSTSTASAPAPAAPAPAETASAPAAPAPAAPAPAAPAPAAPAPAAPAPAPVVAPTIVISASSTQVRADGSTLQAMATIDSAPAAVEWSVKAPGTSDPGSISSSGVYKAPASGGGYDIIITATLISDPTIKSSVSIKIIAAEQIFVGCQQGTALFPISANVYQLPTDTKFLPDFTKIGAKLSTVCMDQYNVAARSWTDGFPGLPGLFEWFALQTTTNLQVATAGTYNFKLNSDDGAKLYIDGVLLIDNDGQHAPTAKEASKYLTAGSHTLSINYFQGPRVTIALELFWKTPGETSYVYVPKTAFK